MNGRKAKALRKIARETTPADAPLNVPAQGPRIQRYLVGSGTLREAYRGLKKIVKRGEPFGPKDLT